MVKFIKPGRIVILLSGRHAGKKAVVVKQFEELKKGTRKFAHCLVAGIERYPVKVHKRMSKAKIAKKCKVIPFVKYVNYTHIIPTRYMAAGEFDLKEIVTDDSLKEAQTKSDMLRKVRTLFEEKYTNPKTDEKANNVKFFFKKLKF